MRIRHRIRRGYSLNIMKILYLGDSITDAQRDRSNPDDLGLGYVKYATANIRSALPDSDIRFYNRGISGNRTSQVIERLDSDVLDINPDIVVLLIGVNDVWHHYHSTNARDCIETPDEQFEINMRKILDAIKHCGAKLLMLEPYMLPVEDKLAMLPELDAKIRIERKLAREYADAYISLSGRFSEFLINHEFADISDDGVHPNESGRALLGKMVSDALIPMISEIA